MAKFRVPVHMAPGVSRPKVGFFRPGDEFELPDRAWKPGELIHPDLEPVDEEAKKALEKSNKIRADRKAGKRVKDLELKAPKPKAVLAPAKPAPDQDPEDEEQPKNPFAAAAETRLAAK